TLTWDNAHRLSKVSGPAGDTKYVYDADGQVLLQKDPTSTVLYLPGQQLTLTGTSVTGTRYTPLPGGGTVVRTGLGTNYRFEITDPHGTAGLSLDNTCQTPTWRQFTPYGTPRGTTVSWFDNRGFLNKPTNTTTGLTTLGVRQYDPGTGRFISPDPLFESTDSQQLGGYNYAGGNPVVHSDPTGLSRNCYQDDGNLCGGVSTPPISTPSGNTGTPSTPGSTNSTDGKGKSGNNRPPTDPLAHCVTNTCAAQVQGREVKEYYNMTAPAILGSCDNGVHPEWCAITEFKSDEYGEKPYEDWSHGIVVLSNESVGSDVQFNISDSVQQAIAAKVSASIGVKVETGGIERLMIGKMEINAQVSGELSKTNTTGWASATNRSLKVTPEEEGKMWVWVPMVQKVTTIQTIRFANHTVTNTEVSFNIVGSAKHWWSPSQIPNGMVLVPGGTKSSDSK
ncbi:RHS repeat-associated protein, partial [Kitasatospora sp. SolWspMP-SS2h]|uniref:RHS repeat domain-containing protein n=1 Tax=Kitasatospora sp. SolWspMP-SS2h TaxID=1305729 RepID=UPI000DBFDE4C